MPNSVIFLLGGIGDGKSTSGNRICEKLGLKKNPFSESAGADAHTAKSLPITIGEVTVVDTPGLIDSKGKEKDEENLRDIVNCAKSIGYVNAFLLVVNPTRRLDHALQDAFDVLERSFGEDFFNNVALLYTRCAAITEKMDLTKRTEEFRKMISDRCRATVGHLPFYYLDNHAEDLAEYDVPDEDILKCCQNREQQIDELLSWARNKPQYPMQNAGYGIYYENIQRLIEEKKKQEELERKARYADWQRQETYRIQQENMEKERREREWQEQRRRDEESERCRRADEEEKRRRDNNIINISYETKRIVDSSRLGYEYTTVRRCSDHKETKKIRDRTEHYHTERKARIVYESGRVYYGDWEYVSSGTSVTPECRSVCRDYGCTVM